MTESLGPHKSLTGIVVICTRARPDHVERACEAVHRADSRTPILVIDASAMRDTEQVCTHLRRRHSRLVLTYIRATKPGLAQQRNEAIELVRALGYSVVHFIDDDTEVQPGYFRAIEERFSSDSSIAGVGGVIVNQPVTHHLWVRRLFLLASDRPSVVLRSGRNVMGQYPNADGTVDVDWLSGCSMSFRTNAFDDFGFDPRHVGYSIGEDAHLGFLLSRSRRLVVEPRARCQHHVTAIGRVSNRALARERTLVTRRWVLENRHYGLSPVAFWWSMLGDVVLRFGGAVLFRERRLLAEAAGIVEAVGLVAMRRVAMVRLRRTRLSQ